MYAYFGGEAAEPCKLEGWHSRQALLEGLVPRLRSLRVDAVLSHLVVGALEGNRLAGTCHDCLAQVAKACMWGTVCITAFYAPDHMCSWV